MADLMDVQDSVSLDDYGSPSSSSAASLYSVMSTLYCLSIAADFRKPVEVLYPNIANSYLSVIKNPMDLGTLLLECMKGNATVNSIRQGLRLVFSNSLLFNAGSPMMEAISQHLESFASGLFEEATRLPFNEKKPLLRDFNEELIYRRSYRLNSVCRIPLKDVEVRCIENVLLAVQEKLPMELEEAMANMMETILKYYNSVGSKEHSDEIAPILTMELIFKPFLEATRAPHPMLLADDTEGYTVLPSLVGLLGIPIGIERTHTHTHSLPLQLQPMTSIPISHMSSNDMRQLTSAPSLTSLSKMELNMMPVDCLLSVDMIGARTAESVQNQDQILHLSNLPLNPTIPHTHNAMSNVSAIVNNGDSNNNNSSSSSGSNSNITDNTNINGNGNGNGNTMTTQKNSYSPILPSTLPYLTALDDRLGSLCVRLEERLLRGTNHSSVWQRPLALMWAQPAKAPWWPAMILASGDTKSVPRTPAEVSVTNISRIPSTICKQLFKLKAKFQTNTADTRNFPSHSGASSLLTVPDGYALVEFFGTHDFGWVKQDTMIPMLLNGSFGGQGGKIGCGAEGLKNSIYTGRWLSRAESAYMAPWHRTRYFNSLRQQERAQRKAIAAMNKKSDTAVGHGASKGTGGGVGGGHGGGGGAGGGGGGTMDLTGDILNNMKYAENDRDGSHAAGNGLQGESGAGQGDTTEKRDGHVTEGEVSIESKEEMDIERKHGDDRGIGEGDEEVEEEEEADYQWRDEDDDEEDDMFDTSLPQMEDLEEEVSLPRLFGGHCSVNMFIEDDERAQPAPASTLKHLQSLSKARGNACNEQKKRKRASAGGGKAKAQPKPVAVPKGRGGAGGGAGKAAPQTASAAPDAGQRAEAGDLSGLLVNGLFMTSVLIVDAYLVAKDAAIEKTFYFTRWTEMISPVPGGPTLPERKRGGRKKVIDESVNNSEVKVEKASSELGAGESVDVDKEKSIAGLTSTITTAAAAGMLIDVKKKSEDASGTAAATPATTTAAAAPKSRSTGLPIKRRRRKRSTAEPSIDALCLHIKPGRKAGWAAIQAANAAAAAESLLDSGGEDLSGEEDDYEKSRKEGAFTPGPMTPGSAAITGPFHILYGGCTHHTAGEGAIHTRSVDVQANIFHRESRSRERRKEILRNELLIITESLSKLQSMAAGRDKEKAAERERLRRAVLSRGAQSKTSGGRNIAVGSNRLPGKTGLLRAIIDQQPVIKPVLPPAKPAISPVLDASVCVPPKVWMPTAALNLDTAHMTASLSSSSVADMETSSEASDGVGEGEGEGGGGEGGEEQGERGDDSERKRARAGSEERREREEEGVGGGGNENENENGSGGGSGGEGESERGIADQETEDEAEPEKEESEEADSDQDGVLAMANVEAPSDVETEDENFAEDEEEEEEEEEEEGDTSYGGGDGDEEVGGDGEGEGGQFEMNQEDSNGSSKYLENDNDNDNNDNDDETEEEGDGDGEVDMRAQSFSSGDEEDDENEEIEEENDAYMSE